MYAATNDQMINAMVENGFDHIAYGSIFLKDGVHVSLTETESGLVCLSAQKLADHKDENSNVVGRATSFTTYSVFQGAEKITNNIALSASDLVSIV